MRLRSSNIFAAALALAALSTAASALEVKLTVGESAGVARKAGTVTSGVPFAKGAVKDISRLSVSAGGKVVPAQFTQTGKWDDGSVRWALLDCLVDVPAKGKTELVVRDDGKNPAPPQPVSVADSAAEVKISTGALELVLDKKSFNLFKSVKAGGKEVVNSSGKGLVVYAPETQPKVKVSGKNRFEFPPAPKSPGKPVAAGAPDEVKVESAGPVRATVMLRGKYPGLHDGKLGYTVRVTAWAGQGVVKVRAWLENRGAHGYTGQKSKTPS